MQVQYEVIRDGIVLLNSDEDRRIALEHRIMSLYLDRRYYMQRHTQELIARDAGYLKDYRILMPSRAMSLRR